MLVGADEMALTCNGLGVIKGIALHAVAIAVRRFDNAHLIAAVGAYHHAGDARGEVGGVLLIGAGGQRSLKALAGKLPFMNWSNGVGLVAVGHDGGLPQGQHSVVDNEVRVLQLGGVGGYGADAARSIGSNTRLRLLALRPMIQ